jgi:ADP-ribosylglycohydrolase
MLVELAVGDAYGAGFEFAPEEMVRRHNKVRYYVQHPRHDIRPGCYTDDTQMTLAIVEALLSREAWTAENLAERFVAVYLRDPRPGYAARFYAFLQTVRDGADLLARIDSVSDRSGAAMRAAPLGLLPTIDEIMDRCRVQAIITHNTPAGIDAALAAALMTYFCVHQVGPKQWLPMFLENHVPGEWLVPWSGKVGEQGLECVRAAVTALVRNWRLSELLKDCVAFTGDVDTAATLALAAASCCVEYDKDLPAELVLKLENGLYGRDYLAALDRLLFERYGLRPRTV